MDDVDEFLAAVLPPLTAADTALHNGDAAPRMALWSHTDPVTLFGAVMNKAGWHEVAPAFEWLASRFADCRSFEYEVTAAGASGDLGYIAGFEHTTASIAGAPPQVYTLRVTTVFRREEGEWKVVHRHADSLPDSQSSRGQVDRLGDELSHR